MPTLELILITRDPEVAGAAERAGVDLVMVDLEHMGKADRQRGKDTPINCHTLGDITVVRSRLSEARLLTRLNPYHAGTEHEVNEALARGAQLFMVPMARLPSEVRAVQEILAGRAELVLLAETPQAIVRLPRILQSVEGLYGVHVGLNDLSIGMGLNFLFEPLAGGVLDEVAAQVTAAGLRFGFGGIGRPGGGQLPALWILSEHVRLGSSMVILSRSFIDGLGSGRSFDEPAFTRHVALLRQHEAALRQTPFDDLLRTRDALRDRVWELASLG